MTVVAPTLAGYLDFLQNTVQIPSAALPTNSPYIQLTYDVSVATVNRALCSVSSQIYTLAVYNLATSLLLSWCPDQAGPPPQTYFANAREQWNINNFITGVVNASSDEGTSQSMVVQKAAENFTLDDLQRLKDPYGRQYLQWAQKYGSLWGLT